MANRLVKPSTRVGLRLNFWRKASERLCAGSVEMMSTLSRAAASATASAHEQVVFPTPPLPPTNTQRSEVWATTFWRVGSSSSGAAAAAAEAIAGDGIAPRACCCCWSRCCCWGVWRCS